VFVTRFVMFVTIFCGVRDTLMECHVPWFRGSAVVLYLSLWFVQLYHNVVFVLCSVLNSLARAISCHMFYDTCFIPMQ
jgi:hypothetical protein